MADTAKIDLSEQYGAAQQQKDPDEWARRLDEFISSRPETAVPPLEGMTRDAIYD